MIEIKGKITKKDYSDFNKYHSKNSKALKKSRLIMVSIWPVMNIFSNLINNRPFDGFFVFNFLIILMLSVLTIPVLLFVLMKLSVLNTYRENKNNDMFMDKLYRFDQSGIEVESNLISSKFSWDSIADVGESKTAFYLYTSSIGALTILKEWIEDNDYNEFSDYLKGIK